MKTKEENKKTELENETFDIFEAIELSLKKGKEIGRREVLEKLEKINNNIRLEIDYIEKEKKGNKLAEQSKLIYGMWLVKNHTIIKDLTTEHQTPHKRHGDTPTHQCCSGTNLEEGKVSKENDRASEETSSGGCGKNLGVNCSDEGTCCYMICGINTICDECKLKQSSKDEVEQ